MTTVGWLPEAADRQTPVEQAFALAPNVYVQSTAGFIRGKYTFDELMDLWPRRCQNMGFYDYFSVWLWVCRSTCGDCTTPSVDAADATGADATSAPPAAKPATARKVFSRKARIPICFLPNKCTTRRPENDLDPLRGRQRGNGHGPPLERLRMRPCRSVTFGNHVIGRGNRPIPLGRLPISP